MKKEDITNEIISKKVLISTDKNFLQLFNNIDISMYGARAWAFSLQEIGIKKGNISLFNYGYIMGRDAAEEINENLKRLSVFLPEKFKLISNLIEITGFGVIEIIEHKKNKLKIKVKENQTFVHGEEVYGKNSKIPFFYMGVYSGFFQILSDFKSCKFKLSSGNKSGKFFEYVR
jgi:hypothetical protein